MNAQTLIKILEVSVKKHGEKTPVTLRHLLNIVKMVDRAEEGEALMEIKQHESIVNEINPMGQD